MNEKELFDQIQSQVRDGFKSVGDATSPLFEQAHSTTWLIGAVNSLEQTAKLLRENIEKNTTCSPIVLVADEIAKLCCHTSGICVITKGNNRNGTESV